MSNLEPEFITLTAARALMTETDAKADATFAERFGELGLSDVYDCYLLNDGRYLLLREDEEYGLLCGNAQCVQQCLDQMEHRISGIRKGIDLAHLDNALLNVGVNRQNISSVEPIFLDQRDIKYLIEKFDGIADQLSDSHLPEYQKAYRLADGRIIVYYPNVMEGELYRNWKHYIEVVAAEGDTAARKDLISDDPVGSRREYLEHPYDMLKSYPEFDDQYPSLVPALIADIANKLSIDPADLDHSMQSLHVLDVAIQQSVGPERALRDLLPQLVAYSGEVIIHVANGQWVMVQSLDDLNLWEPVVVTTSSNRYEPYYYVVKTLSEHGPNFSIHGAITAELLSILHPGLFSR